MEANHHIVKLIAKSIVAALSKEEQRELEEWIARSPQNRKFYDQFSDEDYLARKEKEQSIFDTDASWKKFEQEYYGTVSVNSSKRSWWRNRYVAAACILLLLGIAGGVGWIYYSFSAKQVAVSLYKEEADPVAMSTIMNFSPIGDKSTLILPDGLTVDLDSLQKGDSILVENSYVKKVSDDKLVIQDTARNHLKNHDKNGAKAGLGYAALNMARKKKYQLILSDGTSVWLNEFSSLRFPMNFDSGSRDVALVGEAYFGVMSVRNKAGKIPFVVKTRKINVNVVGTYFNVNAYDTALDVRTTLIEGKIQIVHEGKVNEMLPGQQARLTQDGILSIKKQDNPKEEIAWANKLVFHDKPLQEILQQVAELHNVQFSFKCCEIDQYNTTLRRDMTLNETLEHMEKLEDFHFVNIGEKIVVEKGVGKKGK